MSTTVSALTDEEFAAVRAYLTATAGLAFDESRRGALVSVLAERLQATGLPDVMSYLGLLGGNAGTEERQHLLDSVTVQETQFFRNAPQMEALRRTVLPDLLRRAAGPDRPLTVWSAGCSTGEEPYTLAMLLQELSPSMAGAGLVRVVGTDVSAEALRTAARATYSGRTLEPMPSTSAARWLEPRPGGAYGVKDEVRRLVQLRAHNLVTEPPPFAPGQVDLVLCRNVTIYFDRETTSRVIGTLHDVLAPGGYLVLGHSETLWQVSEAFTLLPVGDAFVYQRTHPAPRTRGAAEGRPASGRRRPTARPRPPRPAEPVPETPSQRAEARLASAREALREGAYDVAARTAGDAVTLDPLHAEAYLVLGEARSLLGEDSPAVAALRKAVYLDPALAPAHFVLGSALGRLGQSAAAAASYRAAAVVLAGPVQPRHAPFLSGRDPQEIAALCLTLAAEQDGLTAASGAVAGEGAS